MPYHGILLKGMDCSRFEIRTVGMSSRSSGFYIPSELKLSRQPRNACRPLADEQELIPTVLISKRLYYGRATARSCRPALSKACRTMLDALASSMNEVA